MVLLPTPARPSMAIWGCARMRCGLRKWGDGWLGMWVAPDGGGPGRILPCGGAQREGRRELPQRTQRNTEVGGGGERVEPRRTQRAQRRDRDDENDHGGKG